MLLVSVPNSRATVLVFTLQCPKSLLQGPCSIPHPQVVKSILWPDHLQLSCSLEIAVNLSELPLPSLYYFPGPGMKQITGWRGKTKALPICLNFRSSKRSFQLQSLLQVLFRSQFVDHFPLLIPILLTSLLVHLRRPLPNKQVHKTPCLRVCFSGIHFKTVSIDILHHNYLNCSSQHSPSKHTAADTLTPMLPAIMENDVFYYLVCNETYYLHILFNSLLS